MTKKIVNSVKYIGLLSLVLLSVIACERDFENIGVGLVDNNEFATSDTIFEVIAYNKNVESSRVDGIPEYLLGILEDDNFGYIKTLFVSQLGLPTSTDFGNNVSIDAVILDIPYYATREDNYSDGKPQFKLDSIFGNQETEYNISVYESGTFLNALEPLDPTKNKKYYSNETYNEKTLLYSQLFNPERNDTVLYVKRRFLDDDSNTVDDTDTIKAENSIPSIKMSLDTVFFRNNFINQQNTGVLDSRDSFIDFFRGIIIKAEEDVNKDGSLMALAMSNANVRIYYTNTILTDETDTDLNNDGDTDDTDVPVRTKQTMIFPLSGIRANQYNRDYLGSLASINERFVSPDLINGEDKLYIQGASGSMGVVELLLSDDAINEMRDKNWLINEANLTLYLDDNSFTQEKVPDQLLLYNYDDNSQILDVITEVQVGGIGGVLERDEDNKPIKYKFRITDYISEFLKSDDEKPVKFGLKVFHSTDVPLVIDDTNIDDFSWIAKGVVLKGNKLLDENDPQRLKLEIFYTINND
ncbi:MAG: DUF4270 domain-containing protein [Flavobacteriaceae bacterium]|nr:DUF4270 domain-containing protein [Flavobacteriaceae bacterium]